MCVFMDLGRVGIWSGVLRRGDPAEAADAAAELDELGFGALWIPGGAGGDVLGDSRRLLDATKRAVVATGILNVWMHDPQEVAPGPRSTHGGPSRPLPPRPRREPRSGGRAQPTSSTAGRSARWSTTSTGSTPPLRPSPTRRRCSPPSAPACSPSPRERTAGAHPYFVPPEHTAIARADARRRPVARHRADGGARDRRHFGDARGRPREHCPLPRVARTTRTTSAALGLHRRRPRLARHRPPRRRHRRVG